jgi:uncharacterized protein YraI
MDCVVASAAIIVNEKVFVAVALVGEAESVTVTVYVVAAFVAAGVPVIAPVDALIDKPEDNAGEIVYVYEGIPPLPVTGINEVAATLLISVVVGMVWTVVNATSTDNVNVFVAVTEAASVTVTV